MTLASGTRLDPYEIHSAGVEEYLTTLSPAKLTDVDRATKFSLDLP